MNKLSECVEILDYKRVPLSGAQRENLAKIFPYYGAQGIIDYVDNYLFDGEYILVAEDGNNLKSLNENIATWATGKFWVNNHAHILGPKEGYNLKYIYYLLNCLDLRGYITGSAQPKLNQENLANVAVNLPNKKTQDKVAELLSLLDDNISNNNAICAELEAMAKTIYDYWFLQFDFPDENGKPYKSSGGKMVWSEELKREIPEGWIGLKVGDCIRHVNTGLNPRDNFVLNTGDIKYLTVKNLTTNGTIDFSSCDTIDTEAQKLVHKRSDVSKGDILFASIAPLGRCAIVRENPTTWDINESVFSIRPNTERVSSEYLYLYFMSDAFIKKAEQNSTGSVFSGIRVSVLTDMAILVPDKAVMKRFTDTVSTFFDTKYQKEQENHELSALRQFLLPLIMNGQVGFKTEE